MSHQGHSLVDQLAHKLGIKLNLNAKPFDGFHYDGEYIAVKDEELMDITHEIAHWILASPERRSLPNFGLGAGPADASSSHQPCEFYAKRVVLPNEAAREEARASLLGILIGAYVGSRHVNPTLDDHGWFSNEHTGSEYFDSIMKELEEMGHVRKGTQFPVVLEGIVSSEETHILREEFP